MADTKQISIPVESFLRQEHIISFITRFIAVFQVEFPCSCFTRISQYNYLLRGHPASTSCSPVIKVWWQLNNVSKIGHATVTIFDNKEMCVYL